MGLTSDGGGGEGRPSHACITGMDGRSRRGYTFNFSMDSARVSVVPGTANEWCRGRGVQYFSQAPKLRSISMKNM